jgi:(p)ppGpp synthase/HD superfamily hydrolase
MAKQNKSVAAKSQSTPLSPQPGDMFDRALQLAIEAHRGQTDKYNQPYMLHVLGVMGRCRTIEEKIVALLHDVVEDTDHTFDDLRELGISERIITAVELLTRRRGETYDHFVERIAPDPLARAVKLADLEDNMDVRRSTRAMKEKDAERMEKYRTAWQKLAGLHVGSSEGEAMKPKGRKGTKETGAKQKKT